MRFAALLCGIFVSPLVACAQNNDIKPVDVKSTGGDVTLQEAPSAIEKKQSIATDITSAHVGTVQCHGVMQQGGAVLCQTAPHAKVKIARSDKDFYFEKADAQGRLLVGFDRDEKQNFIEVAGQRVTFDLTMREYDISRINGLPPSQVSTFTDAQLKHIYRKTTNFGAQRILNGEKKRPHYGVDMAAPTGTPIYAPADGVVSLADDDLYFEGAMVLLDHGQGLISMYLHTDEILVTPGQRVKQGEQIATIGSKGRSTGPHLCWRLKWRNRNLDPELLTAWPAG